MSNPVPDKWTMRIAATGAVVIGVAGLALGKDEVLLAGVIGLLGLLGFILGKQL